MYSTTWCGFCKKARAYLAQNNIPYREIDIEESPANRDQYKAHGGKGVPMFILGERRLRGFSEEKFAQFLAASR
jgi:glutaredoxin